MYFNTSSLKINYSPQLATKFKLKRIEEQEQEIKLLLFALFFSLLISMIEVIHFSDLLVTF